MERIWICDDLEHCRLLWRQAVPEDRLFSLWELRNCFREAFGRTPCFIACEDSGGLAGLLPLSRIDPTGTLACFPGETWHGKTWLEQNPVVARSPRVFQALLEALPSDAHLRYLKPECVPGDFTKAEVDEVGYLFLPREHGFSFRSYLERIPGKTRKRLLREPDLLVQRGVEFRYGRRRDVEHVFRMNLENFGEESYFYDERFLAGFQRMISELDRREALRVTTVLIGGVVAAVDVGAVWGNDYTLLAGATNGAFPGVAKLINFHHLETACGERFDSVDFLCGDFGWKERFRLVPRPLYQITLRVAGRPPRREMTRATGSLAHA